MPYACKASILPLSHILVRKGILSNTQHYLAEVFIIKRALQNLQRKELFSVGVSANTWFYPCSQWHCQLNFFSSHYWGYDYCKLTVTRQKRAHTAGRVFQISQALGSCFLPSKMRPPHFSEVWTWNKYEQWGFGNLREQPLWEAPLDPTASLPMLLAKVQKVTPLPTAPWVCQQEQCVQNREARGCTHSMVYRP